VGNGSAECRVRSAEFACFKLKVVGSRKKIGADGFLMADQLIRRTKAFALDIVRLVGKLPKTRTAYILGTQLLRCGTSVGANYRAACRARWRAEFIAKMGIVEEEADESVYWMELLNESGIIQKSEVEALLGESNQIVAMVVASINTAKRGNNSRSRPVSS
jgi:four helix bundle protein